MPAYESLPDFTSEKPCPRCGELLHWSTVNPPKDEYSARSPSRPIFPFWMGMVMQMVIYPLAAYPFSVVPFCVLLILN